jgi:hypothetical protein
MSNVGAFPAASAAAVAAALGISLRSARRYKAAGQLPFPYAVMWAVLGCGDLGAIRPEWRGWRIHGGQIVTPDGYGFSPGELAAVPIRYQHLAALERERSEPRQLMLTHFA